MHWDSLLSTLPPVSSRTLRRRITRSRGAHPIERQPTRVVRERAVKLPVSADTRLASQLFGNLIARSSLSFLASSGEADGTPQQSSVALTALALGGKLALSLISTTRYGASISLD